MRNGLRRIAVIGLALAASTAGLAQAPQSATELSLGSQGYSRPARSPHSSRSEVIAPHGMVAASQPLAAQVGMDILKSGGNAMLGLVEPNMNGIGGDLFAIVWSAEDEQLYGLNATGRGPYEISRDVFARRGSHSGAGRWAVDLDRPGCGRWLGPTASAVRNHDVLGGARAGDRIRPRRFPGERDYSATVARRAPREALVDLNDPRLRH